MNFSYTVALNDTNSHTNFYPYNNQANSGDQSPTPSYSSIIHSRYPPNTPHRHTIRHHPHDSQTQPPAPPMPQIVYRWEMSSWSECDQLCNGRRFRTAACTQTDNNRNVLPSNCRSKKPDDEYQTCNTDCETE